MKKKLRFSALLLSAVLLAGCAGSTESNGWKGNAKNLHEITIYNSFAFQNGQDTDLDAKEEWETSVSRRYGTTVSLETEYDYFQMLDDIKGGKQSGLVALDWQFIVQMAQNGQILPMDEYLKENRAWNTLADSYRRQYEYNGHIWAIPTYNIDQVKVSSIRSDWLKKVGLELPRTVKELESAGKAFLQKDVNGDGVTGNDFLLGCQYGISNDIFNAFGLYLYDNKPVAYDPTQDCIVNAMFKPEAEEALLTIRRFYQEGIIDPDAFFNPNAAQKKVYSGLYGTYQGDQNFKYNQGISLYLSNKAEAEGQSGFTLSDEDYAEATAAYDALPPLSSQFPLAYSNADGMGYILASGTQDPGTVVNTFVDMLFGSLENTLECSVGTKDHYTVRSDKVVILKYQDAQTRTYPTLPNIIGINGGSVLSDPSYFVSYESDTEGFNTRQMREGADYSDLYINTYQKTGQLVRVPLFYTPQSQTLSQQSRSIDREFTNLMAGLANDSISVEDLLTQYRSSVRDLHQMETILQESNENIGKPSKQSLNAG